MFGLDMLDVAIGVVVIYLLLSLVASAIAEIAESKLKFRSKFLRQGIRELLQQKDDSGLVETFYKHPLVSALYRGEYSEKNKRLPSYIPSRTFALAFLDIVKDPEKAKQEIDRIATSTGNEKLAAVASCITAATSDEKERKRIEEWFDGSMDRVSGWYKRQTHVVMMVIGILMAVTLNVDSIYIIKHLNSDKAAREALVNRATELAKTEPQPVAGNPQQTIENNIAELDSYGLPIGWDRICEEDQLRKADIAAGRTPVRRGYVWFLRILGWLMTGLAISLGAPFWFDTLNKIMVIRSTVKPAEKSKEEGSEDRKLQTVTLQMAPK